ncbi:hypothetical protein [Lactobacillus sp. CBA3605]|nr:hypothetical protein [Lactobacillus sp. CBA3605]
MTIVNHARYYQNNNQQLIEINKPADTMIEMNATQPAKVNVTS